MDEIRKQAPKYANNVGREASDSAGGWSEMREEQNSYRTQFPEPDWHEVAEQASKESDPRKLSHLIQALCDRLEELQNERKRSREDGRQSGNAGAND